MHARNRDAIFEPHELRQHFRPLDDGDFALPCLDHFRVLLIDRGASDHDPRANYIGGGVTFKNGRAQAHQSAGDAGLPKIGSGNGVAHVQQNLSYSAHPDPANSNEMNTLRLGEHSWGRKRGGTHFPLLYQPASSISRWASGASNM